MIGGWDKTLIIRPPTDHTDSIPRTSKAKEWVVERWEEMDEVEEFARHNPGAFDWFWLDSISLMQDHLLYDVMAFVEAAKPHRKGGPIDQGEYQANFVRITKWVQQMVGMPGFNFGMTAHPAELPDNLGVKLKRPWIQGKNMSFKISGFMNILAYMEVVESKGEQRRVLRLDKTKVYDAKDQFGIGKEGRMVDPSMSKIMAALPENKIRPKRTSVRKINSAPKKRVIKRR